MRAFTCVQCQGQGGADVKAPVSERWPAHTRPSSTQLGTRLTNAHTHIDTNDQHLSGTSCAPGPVTSAFLIDPPNGFGGQVPHPLHTAGGACETEGLVLPSYNPSRTSLIITLGLHVRKRHHGGWGSRDLHHVTKPARLGGGTQALTALAHCLPMG